MFSKKKKPSIFVFYKKENLFDILQRNVTIINEFFINNNF